VRAGIRSDPAPVATRPLQTTSGLGKEQASGCRLAHSRRAISGVSRARKPFSRLIRKDAATFSRSRKTSLRFGIGISAGGPLFGCVVCFGMLPLLCGISLQE